MDGSRRSWNIWEVHRDQLGLDNMAHDIPFHDQHHAADIHLRDTLPWAQKRETPQREAVQDGTCDSLHRCAHLLDATEQLRALRSYVPVGNRLRDRPLPLREAY